MNQIMGSIDRDHVDFIAEFETFPHLVDKVLMDLSAVTILKASKVSQAWHHIITQSPKYPKNLSNLYHHYQEKKIYVGEAEDLLSCQSHIDAFTIESHKMYPGGDVKTVLVDKDSLFLGLASGLTKKWDISNLDNFKYPATKYFDPDNGKGVTHLDKNDTVLASGHGDIVLIWSLDTSCILSGSICLDSRLDFVGQLALSSASMLTVLTRFNGYLRVYKDYYVAKYDEMKLEAVPKKVSLTKEALIYSYSYQESPDILPWFWTHKLNILKLNDADCKQMKTHTIDLSREIAWIFQDYPLLFLELAFLGNKELQMWDLSNLNHIYTVQIQDFSLRYLSMKNWIFWCIGVSDIGVGKGQLTYGSILDLMDQKFYRKKVVEDSDQFDDNLHLSFISDHILIFSKPGGIEMKVFILKKEEILNEEDNDIC